MTEPVIVVEELQKSYGSVRAVDAISFEVAESEPYMKPTPESTPARLDGSALG